MIHELMTVEPAGFETLYETAEGLTGYLADVRARREQRNSQQKMRVHLQDAIQKITAELVLAEQDHDAEIERELCAVLMECQRRLSLLSGGGATVKSRLITLSHAVDASTNALHSAAPLPTIASGNEAEFPTAPSPPSFTHKSAGAGLMPLAEILSSAMNFPRTPSLIPLGIPTALSLAETYETAVVPSLPVHIDLPIPAKSLDPFTAEQEKHFAMLRGELAEIAARWKEIDTVGLRPDNRDLNRPLCFEMRSLACTLGSLVARARDCGV